MFIGLIGFSVVVVGLFRTRLSGGDACFFTVCLFVVGSLVDLVCFVDFEGLFGAIGYIVVSIWTEMVVSICFVVWWRGWPGCLA